MNLPEEFFVESGSVEAGFFYRRLRWYLVEAAASLSQYSEFELFFAVFERDSKIWEVSVMGSIWDNGGQYCYQSITVDGEHYDGETLDGGSVGTAFRHHAGYLPRDFDEKCAQVDTDYLIHRDTPAWMKALDAIEGYEL